MGRDVFIESLAQEVLSRWFARARGAWAGGVGAALASFLALLATPVCLVAHNGLRFDYPLLKRELEAARCGARNFYL